ncbi:MAG TPA: hypothetical protein PKJ33_00575 [Alphaproteobacteria bacterium]|nr:hypothetical protein [Alphaproteobacteria bacterium]
MPSMSKIIYHGSATKLSKGDIMHPCKSFDSDLKCEISAVFATPDFDYAKKFAITSLLKGHGMLWINNNKIIFQNLKHNINPMFFVFEINSDGFQLDTREEYFYEGEKEILNVHEFNLLTEAEKSHLEIYEFNEFDVSIDKNLTMPERIKNFDNMLEKKQYHKVDITSLIG